MNETEPCRDALAGTPAPARSGAIVFVVLLGAVSLFSDVTYEGARSVLGPYFETLAAGIILTGALGGLAEAGAYALRVVTGYIADRTRAYWTFTFAGYVLNLGAVPLLALAGNWEVAAFLVIVERFGKAVRVPARDALLASATARLGYGKAFGIHELMDQIGAVVGPIWVATALWLEGDLRAAFVALAIPALAALLALGAARLWWGRNLGYESPVGVQPPAGAEEGQRLSSLFSDRRFSLFCSFVFVTNVGFANWMFLGYHFAGALGISPEWIAAAYAAAMGIDAAVAVPLGVLFDRGGLRAVIPAAAIGAMATAVALAGSGLLGLFAAALLWGIAMAFQETVFKAAVALLVGQTRRATAFGWVQAGQGTGWLVGAVLLGLLYQAIGPLACVGVALLCGIGATVLGWLLARSASVRQ